MLKNKIIGVDVDDVLCETIPTLIDWWNKNYPNTNYVHVDDFVTYDIHKYMDISNPVLRDTFRKFYMTDEFKSLLPLENSFNVLRNLKANGNTLHAITSRYDPSKEHTREWLIKEYPGVFSSVVFSDNKLEDCLKLGVKIHIDDSAWNLEPLYEAGIGTIKRNRPWNKNVVSDQSFKNWHSLGRSLCR